MRRELAFCPYVGLQPFSEDHRDYFFGRDRDQRIIISNLYASHLTVLYGASGVGKSSVLLAGVVPKLRESPNTVVIVFRDWTPATFLNDLKSACISEMQSAASGSLDLDSSLPLDEVLVQGAKRHKASILVILDQFEEYFLYHPEAEPGNTFDEELARSVNCRDVDLGFLIALRDDGLAALDRFRTRIPNLLGNSIRLRHLDEKSAKEAIRWPVEKVFNVRFPDLANSIDMELETALIKAARSRQLTGIGGVGQAAEIGEQDWIETPLLQLLLIKLWRAEPWPEHPPRALRLGTFTALGGAEKVVERHLAHLIEDMSPEQHELCARIFDRLVTPSGTKVACRQKDLLRWAGNLGEHLQGVLQRLSFGESRVLRPVPAAPGDPGGLKYEIFHDVLAGAVLEWQDRFLAQREAAAREESAREQAQRAEELAQEQSKRADEKEQAAARLSRALWRARAFMATALLASLAACFYAGSSARLRRLAALRADVASAISAARTEPEVGALLLIERSGDAKQAGGDILRMATDGLARVVSSVRLRATKDIGMPIKSAAFSREGKQLVLALEDGPVVVCRWPEFDVSGVLGEREGTKLSKPQFAQAGRIAAVADNGIVQILSPETRQLEGDFFVPGGSSALSFSYDKSLVAVGGQGTAWVFRAGDGSQFLKLPEHTNKRNEPCRVNALAFSRDARLLATGADDKVIRIWDVAHGSLRQEMAGHAAGIRSLEFDGGGRELVSAGQDYSARIWDVSTGKTRATLQGHSNTVFHASFSSDGKKIVTASADATVRVWNAYSGRQLAVLSSHQGPVAWAQFFENDEQILSASWDGTVKTWKVSGHANRTDIVRFSPNGELIASAGNDGTVGFWRSRTGDALKMIAGHQTEVKSLVFSRTGRNLASGDSSGAIRIWDLSNIEDPSSGKTAISLCCQLDGIEDMSFSPDGSRLVSAAGSDGVVLWDISRQAVVKTNQPSDGRVVEKVAVSPDGKWIAAGTADGMVRLWSASDMTFARQWSTHDNRTFELKFSSDSQVLLTGGQGKVVRLWDLEGTPQLNLVGHETIVMDALFTPDDSRIITSDLNGSIFMWNAKTGMILRSLLAHTDMTTLALSRDGSRLASFSWDRTARIWDTKSGQELAYLNHSEQVMNGDMSPDGKYVATVTATGGVRIAPLDLDELVRLAKSRVTRSLTSKECQRYLNRDICMRL